MCVSVTDTYISQYIMYMCVVCNTVYYVYVCGV